jgi:VWFA-related protein
MYRRAAIAALFLQTVLQAAPQQRPPDAAPEPIMLKSTSRAVQVDVLVNDPSGRPVHGLQKSDFVVTDNGHPRDIRIFGGEIDAGETASSSATTVPRGVYSNRLGMRDSRIVTAIVIDAVPRRESLPENRGGNRDIFAANKPVFQFNMVLGQAMRAINRMQPGQVMAIYGAYPDLRVVQDYTSDPDRLMASLTASFPVHRPGDPDPKQFWTTDALVPRMLSALRDVAGRMSVASGRKSVVWISPAFGTELNLAAVRALTDSTIAAFNDADVPLYAVDSRFSPTCEDPAKLGDGPRVGQWSIVNLMCSQPRDISDEWMEYLASATGGRAFSGGKVVAVQEYDNEARLKLGHFELQNDHGIVSEALRLAVDDSRYAYEMGFYVPESELDGKVHGLRVAIPAKPKFGLRYRSGYTASVSASAAPAAQELTGPDPSQEPARPRNPDEVGIDAKIDLAAKNDLQVSLWLAPETVTRAADGVIALDATFTQTDSSGKQVAKIQETVRVPSPETQTDMVRYARAMKLINGAVLLHVRIRDQATNRAGSITIPIEKQ